MKKLLIACLSSGILVGCSTTVELKAPPSNPAVKLRVTDNRDAAEKLYFRSGVASPVQFFGDDEFAPSPVAQFSRLLESRLPAGSYELDLAKFRVMDIFPQRLSAATSAAITGVLGSMGYAAFFDDSQQMAGQDNITCIVAGRLNQKSVQQKASVPYRISPFAGLVKNDPSFKAAVNQCFEQLSQSVVDSVSK